MIRDFLSRRWSTPVLVSVCALMLAGGYLLRRTITPVRVSPLGHGSATDLSSQHRHAGKTAPAGKGLTADVTAPVAPWDQRWRKLLEAANTPSRTRELAALIEELSRTDPQQALAFSRSVDDWRLRDLLRNAALRGWASVKPDAAADWALSVRTDDRRSAVEALMQGAAKSPEAAVRVALRLCQSDPGPAGDYGHYTIAALVDAGAFDQAVKFGTEVGVQKYPFLLRSAFFQWARNQPDQAMAALDKIADPVTRTQAESEVISGWAWADAKGLAQHALTLPAGGLRAQALEAALPHWVEKDPVAASEWINRFDSGPEFDAGISAIANLQSLIVSQPSSAMDLAGNISDPAKRAHTMRAIFRQWATNNPSDARRFLASTTKTGDRALLENELKDMSP